MENFRHQMCHRPRYIRLITIFLYFLSNVHSSLCFCTRFGAVKNVPHSTPQKPRRHDHSQQCTTITLSASLDEDNIIDAEITTKKHKKNSSKKKPNKTDKSESSQKESNTKSMTLLELMQEASGNSELSEIRVPFIDPLGNSFIDCKISFDMEWNGVSYTIATPHDHSVAICVAGEDGKVRFLKPEDEEMEEVFKIAGAQLEASYDGKLTLRRTPGTLTLVGDLDKYVKMGREEPSKEDELDTLTLLEELVSANPEEDEAYFHETMKKALGEDYMDKIDLDADIDPSLLKLFDPIGESDEELEALMHEIFFEDAGLTLDDLEDDDDTPAGDAVAERLLTFRYEDRLYSLVRMLKPTIIVGREDPVVEMRRLLLTLQEAEVVLPNLERMCMEEFSKRGLFEPNSDK